MGPPPPPPGLAEFRGDPQSPLCKRGSKAASATFWSKTLQPENLPASVLAWLRRRSAPSSPARSSSPPDSLRDGSVGPGGCYTCHKEEEGHGHHTQRRTRRMELLDGQLLRVSPVNPVLDILFPKSQGISSLRMGH